MGIDRRRRAGAIIFNGDRVLMIGQNHRDVADPYRWYHFPGGGIEPGETFAQAAQRELFEETGIIASARRELIRVFTGAYEHRYFLMDGTDLTLGGVTGPELVELDPALGFAAEWVALAELERLPVWPRAVAEHLPLYLGGGELPEEVPVIEEERQAWEGTKWLGQLPRRRACIVLVVDGRLAVMERWRQESGRYATLPGGGVEAGETVQQAARREALEELGVVVDVGARLAIVQLPDGTHQTYLWCTLAGGTFGTGHGDEFTAERTASSGTYEPRLVLFDQLRSIGLRPDWVVDRLGPWIASPAPSNPERFFEV